MNHTRTDGWLRAIVATSVVLHLVVLFWHGAAHAGIPVPLTAVQWAFVIVVIYVLPVVGGIFVWTERRLTGAWLVTLSMFASLLFGFINHFMRASPDYVLQVPENPWRHSFVVSAALLAVTESVGTVVGAVAVGWWTEERLDMRAQARGGG